MTQTTINHRLKQIVDHRGVSVTSYAASIGVAKSTLVDAITKGKDIRFSTIEKILDAEPDISVSWLITGKGEMFNAKNDTKIDDYLSKIIIDILDKQSNTLEAIDSIRKDLDNIKNVLDKEGLASTG